MIHRADIPVRRTDVDAQGRISSVAFLRYLQEARVDMLFGGEGMGARIGRGVVVAGHEVQFAAPMTYRRAPVRVHTWVRELRPGSFTLGYVVTDASAPEATAPEATAPAVSASDTTGSDATNGDARYLVASSRMVPFDLDAGRPRRLSGEERDLLEPWQHDGPQPSSHHQPLALPAQPEEMGPDHPVPAVPSGARFQSGVSMRFDDLDAYRHVNNVIYAGYLEEALHAVLAGARGVDEDCVLAHLSIRYLLAMDLHAEPVRVDLEVSHVGRSSVTFGWRIGIGSAENATGHVTCAAVRTSDGRPRPLSHHELTLLSALPPRSSR